MTPIFICDDNQTHLCELKRIIEACIAEKSLNCTMALATQKGGEIITWLEDNTNKRGIFFLDVHLKSTIINGIALGKIVRNTNPCNVIIYITSHEDAAFLTYKNRLGCMDFILKDDWRDIKKRIAICLDEICKKEETEENRCFVYKGHLIKPKSLFYIETSHNQHRIVFHYKDSITETWGSLKELGEDDLGKTFFRCSRNLIVNLEKIQLLDEKDKMVIFIGGKSCGTSAAGIRALKRRI